MRRLARQRALAQGCGLLLGAALAGPLQPVGAANDAVTTPVVRTLANGLRVVVLRDQRLPTVQIQILVPAGAAQEPERESGVAALTAEVLTRGTTSRTAQDFAAAVERLGGTVAGSAGREYATVSGAFLGRDLEAGLELVADAVLHPIFSNDDVEDVREAVLAARFQARQYPAAIADEHLWGLALAGHPYSRPPLGSFESLTGLRRQQLQSFHREQYRPDRALLAIAGDVDPDRAFVLAEEQFGTWSGRARTPVIAAPAASAAMRIRLVDLPGWPRAEIRFGVRGPGRGAPEADALLLAAWLFGESTRTAAGGREAISSVSWQKDAGLVTVAASARTDSLLPALRRLRARLQAFAAAAPPDSDVAAARRMITNAHALSLDTPAGTMAQWMAATTYGLPTEDAAPLASRLAAVSASQIRAAAARWLDPERMAVVVVGPAASLRAALEPLGQVEVVSAGAAPVAIAAPPSMTTREPTADEVREGRKRVAQALAAHGGLEKLRDIRDSSIEGEMTLVGQGRELKGKIIQVRKEPDRFLLRTDFMQFSNTQVLEGSHAWSWGGARGDSIVEEDSLAVLALSGGFRSDLHHVLLAASQSAARVAHRGREPLGGREVDVVEVVSPGDERLVLFLDPESRRLLAVEQNERVGVRVESVRRVYGDWRTVEGVVWPHHEERLLNGERAVVLTYRKVDFNAGVSDSLFAPPGAPRRDRRSGWR
jgi:predicted Zn-dependent peptidase